MAHFAQIDENGVVLQVQVLHNDVILNASGLENENLGAEFLSNLCGGTWKQTSYNGNFRKNYAGIGFTYDPVRDAFIPPYPGPNWVLNEDTCRWEEQP